MRYRTALCYKKNPKPRLPACLPLGSDHPIHVSMSAVVCGGNVWVRGVICMWGFRGMITNKYMHIICKKRYCREGFIAQFHEQTKADFVLRLLSAFKRRFFVFCGFWLTQLLFHFVKYKGKYVRTSVLPYVPSLLVGNYVIVTSILRDIIFTSTTTTVWHH